MVRGPRSGRSVPGSGCGARARSPTSSGAWRSSGSSAGPAGAGGPAACTPDTGCWVSGPGAPTPPGTLAHLLRAVTQTVTQPCEPGFRWSCFSLTGMAAGHRQTADKGCLRMLPVFCCGAAKEPSMTSTTRPRAGRRTVRAVRAGRPAPRRSRPGSVLCWPLWMPLGIPLWCPAAETLQSCWSGRNGALSRPFFSPPEGGEHRVPAPAARRCPVGGRLAAGRAVKAAS